MHRRQVTADLRAEPLLSPLEIALVTADEAADHHRVDERVASCLPRSRVEDLLALARLVDRREDRVVLVGETHRCAHGARLRGAADDDRRSRLLQRLRPDVVGRRPLARDLLELPVELVEALARRQEREAVGVVLALEPAGADAELGASARDVVDGDDALREHRGGPERDRRHHRPEAQRLRARGETGERRPGIERSRRRALADRLVVVGTEEPFEAGALGCFREREPVLPLDSFLALDHQADAHRLIQAVPAGKMRRSISV